MRAVFIITRFVQLLMIIPIGLGISFAGSFFQLLNGLAQGQPWDFAEFAERLAAFSSPTGLGVAMIGCLESMLRQERETHALPLRYPEQPWLWKPMWAERRIRLSNRKALAWRLGVLGDFRVVIVPVGLWGALGVFGFVIVPVGLWIASSLAAQNAATLVYVFLGLMGTLLLALMRMAWLNRRWGRSELEILTLPGVIGGSFRGTVTLSEPLPEGTALRVTLKCIRHCHYRSRSSESESTSFSTDTIWQSQKILLTAQSMVRPDSVAVPCSFAIPSSCEPTSLTSITGRISPDSEGDSEWFEWELSVRMKDTLDGRYVACEVPVFRTQSRSPDYQEDLAADAAYLEPVDVNALLASIPMQHTFSASGERLRFSFMRKRDFFLFLAFTLALSLGLWAIFRYVSMPLAFFAGFLPGALAFSCYWTLVKGLTWKADIEITADKTTFTAGYIWSRRRYEFLRGQRVPLECRAEYYREDKSVYCVSLVPLLGRPCDIVKRLDGEQDAVAMRDWLVKLLLDRRPQHWPRRRRKRR